MKIQLIRVRAHDIKVGGVNCECCRLPGPKRDSKRSYNKTVRRVNKLDVKRQLREE